MNAFKHIKSGKALLFANRMIKIIAVKFEFKTATD